MGLRRRTFLISFNARLFILFCITVYLEFTSEMECYVRHTFLEIVCFGFPRRIVLEQKTISGYMYVDGSELKMLVSVFGINVYKS